MQCAVVLRVGVNRAFAKFVNYVEFESDVHLYGYEGKFSEHNKF